MDKFAGMHWMLVTPLQQSEEVDLPSIKHIVKKAIDTGCVGIVVLGEMGEWRRLSDSERRLILDEVMTIADGHIEVTIGTTATSTFIAVDRAKEAEEFGGSAIMVAPPPLGKPNPETVETFYKRVADSVNIPIVIQDFPQTSGVHMSPQFIAKLAAEIPSFRYLKLEDPPTPIKVSRIRDQIGSRLGIFGGLGGAFLLDELNRGAIGAMTGFAYPEVLVQVIRLACDGNYKVAAELFNKFLPLIMFENQEGINLSIRKEAIKHRGLISTATTRHPGTRIDENTLRDLLSIIQTLEPTQLGEFS